MSAEHDVRGGTSMPDPSRLMEMSTAYWSAQTLLTANRLGLFTALSGGAKAVEQVSRELGIHPRPAQLFLRACVGLGLLEEDDGRFSNSALTEAFLVPGKPHYLGNAIRYSDNLYETWGKLGQALVENHPPMAAEEYLGRDPGKTRDFVYGMHDRALGIGQAMVHLVDLSGRRLMLDVGGGPGTYSALFAQRFPALRSRVLDLPDVVEIAREIVDSMGAGERVQMLPGDYLRTPFPSGNDTVLTSGVFHRETAATCRALIERAVDSLDSGGLLIVSDVFTDGSGANPPFAALFGVNMMLTAPDGGVHSDADVADWMRASGVDGIEIRPFPPPMPHRIVLGVKP